MTALRRCLLRGTTFAVLATLAGCSSSTSPTPTPTATPLLQSSVALLHMPAGFATLKWSADTGALAVQLSIYGLNRGSKHGLRLLPGSCSSSGGQAVAALPDATADATGAVKATLSANGRVEGLPAASHLTVSLEPSSSGGGGEVIGCAALAGNGSTAPLQLVGSNALAPSGSAVVDMYAGGHLQLHLTAKGLAANSTHAVHIELGRCESRSAQVASFGNATANAAGEVTATLSAKGGQLDLRAVAWDVVVDLGGSADGASAAQPALCGDHLR